MQTQMCLLFTILVFSTVYQFGYTLDEDGCLPHAEFSALPYGDWTHSHNTSNMPNHSSGSGTHTHSNAVRHWQGEECQLWGNHPDFDAEHEVIEDPSPPVIEGYTEPSVIVCVGGPCLEDDKPDTVVTGPVDLEGNVPPLSEPGEPELFYPTIEVDGQIYWDSTQEPYQISEEAENAETTPEGYRLEDIEGQLLLVPTDTSEQTPVDRFSEDPAAQDTFIIYTVVEVVGGQNYLKPTPFHAHPVDDSVDDLTNTGVDSQDPEDIQEGLGIQGGASETFASLDGQFYQVTSNPPIPLQVTEYMVRTWGDGQAELPQWIEVYNPNALAVNLADYEFSYVFKKETHSIELRHFLIPPDGAIILATHIPLRRYRYEGLTEAQVYNLKIEFNALIKGWSLKDTAGLVISQIGKSFGEKENPIKPERVGISRVSHNVYGSERPKDPYFFGFRKDVSTPGFHEPQIPRSPALLRQKMKTTWASFKKN